MEKALRNIICLVIVMTTCIGSAQKIDEGQKAPLIEAETIKGENISLKSFQDNGKTVFIAFLRFAGCPVCNLRVHELSDMYLDLKEKGIEMVVIFESGKETLLNYTEDANLSFPMISDPDGELYALYGIKKSFGKTIKTAFKKEAKTKMKQGKELYGDIKYKRDGSITRIPADFVINPEGIIEIAYYGSYVGDHLDLQKLLDN